MEQESPQWFKYTASIIRSMVPADLSADKALAQVAHNGTNQVKVDRNGIRGNDIAFMASALVHEACHLYQYKEDNSSYLSQYDREKECYTIQAKALREIDRKHKMIDALRCAAESYPLTSLCEYGW